jgi:hypothetical protein
VYAVGLICLGFSLVGVLVSLSFFLTKAPGLIISEKGISIFNVGFIEWKDISKFENVNVYGIDFVYVILKDPEKYIASCNFVSRVLLRACEGISPSPVGIGGKLLSIEFHDLFNYLYSAHENYKKQKT